LYNKRGTRLFKKQRIENPDPELPIDKRGVRDTGFVVNGIYKDFPEKIPELVVPDLKDCKLKPYVSYKTPDVVQSEFTAKDLFNAVYTEKIMNDFKNKQLNDDGSPAKPSNEELLTANEAWINARKTGSDIF